MQKQRAGHNASLALINVLIKIKEGIEKLYSLKMNNYCSPPFEKEGEQSEEVAGNLSNKIPPKPSFSKRGLNDQE